VGMVELVAADPLTPPDTARSKETIRLWNIKSHLGSVAGVAAFHHRGGPLIHSVATAGFNRATFFNRENHLAGFHFPVKQPWEATGKQSGLHRRVPWNLSSRIISARRYLSPVGIHCHSLPLSATNPERAVMDIARSPVSIGRHFHTTGRCHSDKR
jgi:hypothetical protein